MSNISSVDRSVITANVSSTISSGTSVVTDIAKTIAAVSDANQRRKFSQNLDLLNSDQQSALSKALLDANSETERMKILRDVLTDLVANVTEKEKKSRTNTYLAAGAFILVGIGLVALIVKRA
jgi:single-stranded DNA-specific DHH superfamily exonuclease